MNWAVQRQKPFHTEWSFQICRMVEWWHYLLTGLWITHSQITFFFKPFTIILIFLTWQRNLLDAQKQDRTRFRPNTKGNSYSSTVVAFHDEIELFNHPADSIWLAVLSQKSSAIHQWWLIYSHWALPHWVSFSNGFSATFSSSRTILVIS